jgi:zeta-carotene desaturase
MEGATISGKQAAAAILEPTGYRVQGTGLFRY